MEDKSYPKYQYSIFLKNGRDEQLVIRADSFDELIEAKKDIDLILGKRQTEEQPARTKTCNDCGGTRTLREGVKNGKKWAAWFCSNPQCKPDWVNLVKDR